MDTQAKKLSDFTNKITFINYINRYMVENNYRSKNSVSYIIKSKNSYYTKVLIPKKHSDAHRELQVPHDDLKYIQNIIKKLIINQLEYHNYTFPKYVNAFIENRGIFTNAQIHRNKKYVTNIDIQDFFNSIHFGRISGFFMSSNLFKLSKHMSFFFADLLTLDGKLPQGSPASPIISNLIANKLDRHLLKISKKHHFIYSRYADDLTFSTNESISIEEKIRNFIVEVDTCIIKNGFSTNWDKVNTMGPDVRHTVTGLVNNKRVSTSSDFYKKTRAMSHNFYYNNHFTLDNIHHPGITYEQRNNNMSILEGRYSFIYDIEQKNKALYSKNDRSLKYNAITPYNYKDINLSTTKSNELTKINGKEMAFRKFLFFKYFLYGSFVTVFTEGKTDPLYLVAAQRKLDIQKKFDFESAQSHQNNNDGNGDLLFNLLELSQGAAGQQKIISRYKQLYPYFDSKLKPLKPVIILLDFEIYKDENNKKKGKGKNNKDNLNPMLHEIESIVLNKTFDQLKSEISEKGFIHIMHNLYLAATISLSDDSSKNREIETYFDPDFLDNPSGDGSTYFLPLEGRDKSMSRPITKDELSHVVQKKDLPVKVFLGFKDIFQIFEHIHFHYISMLIESLKENDKTTLYNMLDDHYFLSYVTKFKLHDTFENKFNTIFKVNPN